MVKPDVLLKDGQMPEALRPELPTLPRGGGVWLKGFITGVVLGRDLKNG